MTERHRSARHRHGLVLFLRSRRIAAWLVAAVSSAGILWGVETIVTLPDTSVALGLYALTAVVAAAGPGLAGPDLDLDRSAARAWWPVRLAHAVAVAAQAYGLVAAAGLPTIHLARGSRSPATPPI